MITLELLSNIKTNEGFRAMPYDDILGFATIGYGTKLPLTKDEATWLLKYRLTKDIQELQQKWIAFNDLPLFVQTVVCEMVYQLGVNGFLGFKKTIKLLEQADFVAAKKEALHSKWAQQTPKRALKVLGGLDER